MVIGAASNMIIRDGGLPNTVVIKLGKGFRQLEADGLELQAGAAQLDLNTAKFAADAGIGGLSFLAGVPGTIGGCAYERRGPHHRGQPTYSRRRDGRLSALRHRLRPPGADPRPQP